MAERRCRHRGGVALGHRIPDRGFRRAEMTDRGEDLVAQQLHGLAHLLVGHVSDLDAQVGQPVSELVVEAGDLLDRHLGRPAHDEPALHPLLERELAVARELLGLAFGVAFVLEVAGLLDHEPLRRPDAAAEHVEKIPVPALERFDRLLAPRRKQQFMASMMFSGPGCQPHASACSR